MIYCCYTRIQEGGETRPVVDIRIVYENKYGQEIVTETYLGVIDTGADCSMVAADKLVDPLYGNPMNVIEASGKEVSVNSLKKAKLQIMDNDGNVFFEYIPRLLYQRPLFVARNPFAIVGTNVLKKNIDLRLCNNLITMDLIK